VEGYRNFCNKLWNAARYVLQVTEVEMPAGPARVTVYDRWIQSRLQAAIASVTDSFRVCRFDLAAQAVYEFTWYEFCDWYLEFSKTVLQSESSPVEERRGTRATLVETLESLLRLLHPLMPFITEEIWQRVGPLAGKSGRSIMVQPFPVAAPGLDDPRAEDQVRWVTDVVTTIRGIRGQFDIAPSRHTPVYFENSARLDQQRFEASAPAILKLASISGVEWLASGAAPPQSAAAAVGSMAVHIPMAGLIDVDAELARIGKRRGKLEQELGKAQAKLGNANFVQNAPPAVVAQEEQRVADFKRELAQLEEQRERVASLQ
jgi:valyl-tRNA synthetase